MYTLVGLFVAIYVTMFPFCETDSAITHELLLLSSVGWCSVWGGVGWCGVWGGVVWGGLVCIVLKCLQ